MIEMRELLTEGKGKRVYATDDPSKAIVYYKDEAIAFHGLKRGRILGKGEVNNAVCSHVYQMLERHGIATHFVRQLDVRQSLVHRVDMIPIVVKVRNRVAGSLVGRIPLAMGTKLEPTVIECVLKDEDHDTSMVNTTHIRALKLATQEEMEFIYATAMRVNEILMEYLSEVGIELIDIKLEFGRFEGKILVADEISPDTARFWDSRTHEPLDFDRLRRDLGNVEQAYQEVLSRMMGMDDAEMGEEKN